MATYQYEIGTTQENMTNVEDLIGVPPRSEFRPFTDVWESASGKKYGTGSINFRWTFDFLTYSMLESLLTAITGVPDWEVGAGHDVYVKTRTEFGDYQIFFAHCEISFRAQRVFGGYSNFQLEFTNAEVVS